MVAVDYRLGVVHHQVVEVEPVIAPVAGGQSDLQTGMNKDAGSEVAGRHRSSSPRGEDPAQHFGAPYEGLAKIERDVVGQRVPLAA